MKAADMMRFISKWMSSAGRFGALALLTLGLQTQAAGAQQRPPQLVIVFDGSGSMWAKMDSASSKLAAMRNALDELLRKELPDAAIGLVTFGARSGGSCSSAETLLTPAPGQLDQFSDILEKFNPQGRGPVVLGLQQAVQSIKDLAGPVRLLLVHDSPDNCGQDVCTFARELAKDEPRVTVDVVSLGLKPNQRGAMACLTKATGGRLVEAATIEAAAAGLDDIVSAMLSTSGRPALKANPRIASLSKPAPKPAPNTAGLVLSARLAGSQTPIPRGIVWQIDSQSGLKPAISRTIRQPAVDIALPPGRYRISAYTELVTMSKEVDVSAGVRQPVVFEFEHGLVEVQTTGAATANPGAPTTAAQDDALVTVMRMAAGSTETATKLWAGTARNARTLLLDSGRYRVTIGNGLNEISRTIDVTGGSSNKIVHGGKSAHLTVAPDGLHPAQIADAEIRIAVDDPTQPNKRRVIARSTSPRAAFQLPAGPYHITLRTGDSETTALVVLAAGETVTHRPNLPQMALQVTSHVGESEKLAQSGIRYRLWRANQLDTPIAVSRKAQPVFHLPPGKYRIESRIGLQNAVMIREFDVGVGAFGSLELRHRAGRVDFTLPADIRGRRQIAYWEVLDRDRRLVWRSFEASPSVTLAAGTYDTTLEVKGRRFAAKFIVVAGQTQAVTPK